MIGQTISHYKILEKLGEGGMGIVYRAHDTKLDRDVALKFLPVELTKDTQAKERFIHEAKAASALDHNNICTIYEISETDDGRLFMAMACYEGETLKKKIEQGPLKIDNAIETAIQVAQGLSKAHEKGIVHRDIKPANVLLTTDGVVKMLDFGLAKLRGLSKLTKTGSTLGTAPYMSPEQAKGAAVDQRTDIWSLGVVSYEMITGKLPFKGDYEQAITYQIINAIPEPITGLRSGVPMELERIVNKCLEKNPEERYQTAADFIADLKHLQRTTSQSIPLSTTKQAVKASAKKKLWAIIAALLVIGIGLVLIFTPFKKHIKQPEIVNISEKSIAVLPFVDMSPQKDQEYFCDGITEELINRLGNINDLRVPARTSAFFFKGKTVDVREVGNKLNVQTVLEGSIQKSGDRLRITAQLINVADGYHLWSEKYDRELKDVFAIQDEISSAIVHALQLKLTPQEVKKITEHPINNVKAYEYFLRADRETMRFDEKSTDSALVYLRTAIDIMGDNADLYAGMAFVYFSYVNIGIRQEDYLKKAEEYARKSLIMQPDQAGALYMLGLLAFYEDYPRNLYEGFQYYKKVLVVNPNDIRALHGMAMNYWFIGKFSETKTFVERMERQDPLNPRRYIARGFDYLYDCKFKLALEQFRLLYEADQTNLLAQSSYSWMLACNGKSTEALAVIDRIAKNNSNNIMTIFSLLLKYGLLNDKENALLLITPEFRKTCWRDLEWSYSVANRLSLAGAKKEAMDWLENSINRGFINYPFFQCDPFLNNIRNEERFKKLMQRAKYEWEHFEVPE